MESATFNLLMSLLSIVFGEVVFVISVKRDIFKFFYNEDKVIIICVFIGTALLMFMSVICPVVTASDSPNLNLLSFYLLYTAAIIFISFLLYCIAIAENKLKHHSERLKYDEINKHIIEEKYKDIIWLKHNYNKLYNMMNGYITSQNWSGLTDYFGKYIAPLHKSRIENDVISPKLALIENTLIHNLLFDTLIKATHIHNIKIHMDITSVISDFFMSEMDLFSILNEWISNAFQATNQEDSIYLLISGSEDAITIKVINPIYEKIDINAITQYGYTTKQGHNGAGLAETEKTLSFYDNIEHATYIELATFIQCLIIRKVRT